MSPRCLGVEAPLGGLPQQASACLTKLTSTSSIHPSFEVLLPICLSVSHAAPQFHFILASSFLASCFPRRRADSATTAPGLCSSRLQFPTPVLRRPPCRITPLCRGFGTTPLVVSTVLWLFSRTYELDLVPMSAIRSKLAETASTVGVWWLTQLRFLGQISQIQRDCDAHPARWHGARWSGFGSSRYALEEVARLEAARWTI